MDAKLAGIIERRVDEDVSMDPGVRGLVLAAFAGDEQIAAALEGAPEPATTGQEIETTRATGAYLQAVTIEGFRGIGPAVSCDFQVGPGLTLIVGRNGSGKSSIAEGIELLLTGATLRWRDRPAEWKSGFKNLHHEGKTVLRAALHIDGQRGPTYIERPIEDPTNPGAATVQP